MSLADLSETERAQLVKALHSLPPELPLCAVDWPVILSMLRPNRRDLEDARTVSDLIEQIDRGQRDYRALLKAKIDAVGERLQASGAPNPWDDMTPHERRRCERLILEYIRRPR